MQRSEWYEDDGREAQARSSVTDGELAGPSVSQPPHVQEVGEDAAPLKLNPRGAERAEFRHILIGTMATGVLILSALLLVYVVWVLRATTFGATSLGGLFPLRTAAILAIVLGVLLVIASAVLVVLLRLARVRAFRSTDDAVSSLAPTTGAASEPLFRQRLASLSKPADSAGGSGAPGPTDAPGPTGAPEAPLGAESCYGQVGLDIAMLFATTLARTGSDLGGFLNRTVDLLAERCVWGTAAPDTGDGTEPVHIALFLVDEGGEWATLQAASSISGKELVLRGHRVRRGDETSVGWVMTERRVWKGSGSSGAYLAMPELLAMRSAITLPLAAAPQTAAPQTAVTNVVSGEVVGVLDIRSAQPNAFSHDDVAGLSRLAGYLGVAIQTARQLRDAAAAPGTPGPFYETINRLSVAKSEAEVCSVMLEALREFGPERVVIIQTRARVQPDKVLNGKPAELYVAVDAPQMPAAAEGAGVGVRFGELAPPSLVDIVIMGFALDRPLWVGDLSVGAGSRQETFAAIRGHSRLRTALAVEGVESPELASALLELAESSDVDALAFVPLRSMSQERSGHAPVGGILVLYGAVHHFSPLERHLHELLVDLGGMALARSRLLSEAGSQLEREQLLSGIRERLRASSDPDVILRTMVRELGRALGAELTAVELAPDFDAIPESVGGVKVSGAVEARVAETDEGL